MRGYLGGRFAGRGGGCHAFRVVEEGVCNFVMVGDDVVAFSEGDDGCDGLAFGDVFEETGSVSEGGFVTYEEAIRDIGGKVVGMVRVGVP